MTTSVKRIVCLANSDKPGGRCIAGKEILVDGRIGGWVRPISDRDTEEVSVDEYRYADGSEPQVLDVIDVPILGARPNGHQQENWLLDPERYWVKVSRVAWNSLPEWIDTDEDLWINGYSSSMGWNNRIPSQAAGSLYSSLRLIRVHRLEFLVHPGHNKKQVEGCFRYGRSEYKLRVTDPIYKSSYLQKSDGRYRIDTCYLTVSLTEPFVDDHCYKLIAAVIEP